MMCFENKTQFQSQLQTHEVFCGDTEEKQGLVAGPTFLEESPEAWRPAPNTGLTTAIQLSWELPSHLHTKPKTLNL